MNWGVKVDRIIKSYIDNFLESQQINEKTMSKQFELFASYCTIYREYGDNFPLEDAMTGSGGDCGIDSIAIIVNGHLLTTFEEAQDIVDSNKNLSSVNFIFTQAKSSPNFQSSEIGTFLFGVKDFFSDSPQMIQNEAIKEKSKIVDYIFQKAVNMKNRPTCSLYYVSTGKWNNDAEPLARIAHGKKDLEDLNLFDNIVFHPVDAAKLQKYYRNAIDKTEITIAFPSKVLLPDIDTIQQSYLGIF